MKISYDKELDALYIRLVDLPQQCHTLRLSDEIALNFGEGERLVGIEILDASVVMQEPGGLTTLVLENLQVKAA